MAQADPAPHISPLGICRLCGTDVKSNQYLLHPNGPLCLRLQEASKQAFELTTPIIPTGKSHYWYPNAEKKRPIKSKPDRSKYVCFHYPFQASHVHLYCTILYSVHIAGAVSVTIPRRTNVTIVHVFFAICTVLVRVGTRTTVRTLNLRIRTRAIAVHPNVAILCESKITGRKLDILRPEVDPCGWIRSLVSKTGFMTNT